MGNSQPQAPVTFESHAKNHGPLTPLAHNLWFAHGTFGNASYRNMVVYRMKNGKGLWLWSTVALVESEMKKIDDLGKVAFISVPNGFHRIDCGVYHQRYPEAKVICPTNARQKVEKKCPVNAVDEESDIFAGTGIKVVPTVGIKAENVFELDISEDDGVNESGSKALVMCDVVFNHMPTAGNTGHLSPISKLFRWYIFSDYHGFTVDMAKRIEAYGDSLKIVCFAHDYHLVTHDDQKPGQILKNLFTSQAASAPVPKVPPYVEAAYKKVPESIKTETK